MKKTFFIILILAIASINFGMSRRGQYDEEARKQEKIQKAMEKETQVTEPVNPVKNFAAGVKEITVDNAKDALVDTADGTVSKHPVAGTLEGARVGGDKVIDNTIKGVKKVASLGFAKDESYEIEEPVDKSGKAAKIKLFQF